MPLLDTGRYTITNARFKNFAALRDANPDSNVVSAALPRREGEGWNVIRLNNDNYTIKNLGFSRAASCETRPRSGDHLMGGHRHNQQWIIKETRTKDHFTISPTDATELFWSMPDGEMKTPIILAETATDAKNHWIFSTYSPSVEYGEYDSESESESEAEAESESTSPPQSSALRPPPYPQPSSDNRPRAPSPPFASGCPNQTLVVAETRIVYGANPLLHPALTQSPTGISRISAYKVASLPESESASPQSSALRPPPYSRPSFDNRPQSPPFAKFPDAMDYYCDSCKADIPATHPRVHCLTCVGHRSYDLCAVCALGERFAGEHTHAHQTVVLILCGDLNQPPVPSETAISYGAKALLEPLSLARGTFSCNSCRTVIRATNPRLQCLTCPGRGGSYDLCAVCALGERFAGEHTRTHPTVFFLACGGPNKTPVVAETRIVYGASPLLDPVFAQSPAGRHHAGERFAGIKPSLIRGTSGPRTGGDGRRQGREAGERRGSCEAGEQRGRRA
ncbi:hypothetical protein B0H11DRAFT_920258 [Mycena galericulata]|nr:hypothetical protein B0H11DRAFT_920258 [Mycena galericulata]